MPDEDEDGPLTEEERLHLERVLAAADADPDGGRFWEDFEKDLIALEEQEEGR